MQRRNLVLLLLGIIVGCIVTFLVLTHINKFSDKDKYVFNIDPSSNNISTKQDKYVFNLETGSCRNRLLTVGIDLDKVSSIDRKLYYALNSKCGGESTGLHDYTWTGILEYDTQFSIQFSGCGGSLISDRYVLTAAYCITNRIFGPPWRVLLGAYNITSDKDCRFILGEEVCAPLPISIDIERIDVHPNWLKQRRKFYDDIALIRLAKSVKSENLQTICLPKASYVPDNHTLFVAVGWGRTEDDVWSAVKLQASLSLFSKDRCSRRLNFDLKDGQICAGGEKKTIDTCTGDSADSGVPLMVLAPDSNTYSIAGLASMGPRSCSRVDVSTVYTFIPKYLDWIFEKMKP